MGQSGEGSEFRFRAIGLVRTPHTAQADTPIQPIYAVGVEGQVEVFEEYAAGLRDLEGFSHILLLYVLDRAGPPRLEVVPYLDTVQRGVFATRAPCRPNPIGLSLVRLVGREGRILHVTDVDMLDGTPLLDIKPYSPRLDTRPEARSGWIESIDENTAHHRGRRGHRHRHGPSD